MSQREKIVTIVTAFLAAVFALFVPSTIAFGIIVIVASVVATALRPMLGWSLVVLAYPFIYLQFFIGHTINIPYVDAFAILTFVGVGIRMCMQWRRGGYSTFNIQHSTFSSLLPFLLFLAVAAFSLVNVDDIGGGIKFLLRPLSFFYLMYIVLPAIIIDRPRRLFTTFRLLFIVGGIAAAMGSWSLVFPP